jgi:hypothetical protein
MPYCIDTALKCWVLYLQQAQTRTRHNTFTLELCVIPVGAHDATATECLAL